jgi:hypothetical protein
MSTESIGAPNTYRESNLGETCDSHIADGHRLVQDYRSKRDRCPTVDADGRSECPFPEELYADASEAKEKLRRKLEECEGYLPVLGGELDRLRRNGQLIEGARSSLRNPEPKAELSQAEQAARAEYEKVLGQRARMERLVARMREVLQEPAPRWPLGKPQKRPRFGAGTASHGLTPVRSPHTDVDVFSSGVADRGSEASPAPPRLPGELGSLAELGGEAGAGPSW